MTAPTATDRVLAVSGVSKSFTDASGSRLVLDDVDLHVARCEIVALVGRSGSGKTTLLTLVAGLEPADRGSISFLGDATRRVDRPWHELAMVPQALGLLGELTVAENVALPLRLAGDRRAGDVAALMERLGIDRLARRLPSEISLGEQQRTALARAAVVGPRLLLADEPISHQNDEFAAVMMRLLTDLAEAGTSCLLATHNEAAVVAAGRVVELRDGRLREG